MKIGTSEKKLDEAAENNPPGAEASRFFFQIYVKDLRQAQEAGIDLWKDQKCDFEYLDSRNVYTYTDSKFVGEKEIRRQLIIQLNRNDQIEKLSIRNFQVNPYLLKEKVLCSETQSRRQYE